MKPSVTSKQLREVLNIAKQTREQLYKERDEIKDRFDRMEGTCLEAAYRGMWYAVRDCIDACNIIDDQLTNFDEEDWEGLWAAYLEARDTRRESVHEQMRKIFQASGMFDLY